MNTDLEVFVQVGFIEQPVTCDENFGFKLLIGLF